MKREALSQKYIEVLRGSHRYRQLIALDLGKTERTVSQWLANPDHSYYADILISESFQNSLRKHLMLAPKTKLTVVVEFEPHPIA